MKKLNITFEKNNESEMVVKHFGIKIKLKSYIYNKLTIPKMFKEKVIFKGKDVFRFKYIGNENYKNI